MPSIINTCISNAITTDVAKVFFINSSDKFNEEIKKSRHKYYLYKKDSELDSLDSVYIHRDDSDVEYDIIICDDMPQLFNHTVNMCGKLHIPFILLIKERTSLKKETYFLFMRDADKHNKLFLNKEIFAECGSPENNSVIGLENWDQNIIDTCNKAFIKWK